MSLQVERNARADALDVRIEQERQLISYYEGRGARAEATAAAAVTAVFALAALLAAAPETSGDVDRAYGWIVVGFLALACVSALAVRTLAGLKHTRTSWLSSGSDGFDRALKEVRKCDHANLDPLDIRQRTLELCVVRATDAHKTAKAKDIAAALASVALAIALIAILILRLVTA